MTVLSFQPAEPTLFGVERCDAARIEPGEVGVVGMPSDWTHSSRIGTRFGPHAARRATTGLMRWREAKCADGDLVDPVAGTLWRRRARPSIRDLGDAPIHAQSVQDTTASIAAFTRAVRSRGGVPLAVGGDHYNSFPACLGYARGLAERHPSRRFGYIQIDGHLDFSDRLGVWGTHNHATNARRISEIENIVPENMVWIGIDGWVDGGDLALIEEMGGLVLSSGDVHRLGPDETVARALAHATRGCESLYLSIDIDAMDAGFLPGTGSIVHSGITPRQYCRLLAALAFSPVDGLDIVELSPPLDPSGRSERIVAQMLEHVLRPYLYERVEGRPV